ncbi:META domain-containing protein [Psychromonas sp.]|uniref:META domain-containing protein n=1 Tax=Psychromonas sp. TaxID=1884585 RepID=UPI0039E5B555
MRYYLFLLQCSPERKNNRELATGKLACNHFFGRLKFADNTLKIDPPGSIFMGCFEVINKVKRILASVLSDCLEIHLIKNRVSLSGTRSPLAIVLTDRFRLLLLTRLASRQPH